MSPSGRREPANTPFFDPEQLDRTWAERVRSGDAVAYEAVFRATFRPLVGYVFRIVHSREIAEELVQEMFLSLWLRRATLEIASGSLMSYLFTAARNRALAHVRRERIRSRWAEREMSSAEIAEAERSTLVPDEAGEVEFALAIRAAVDALPQRCRQVFRLSRERGLTYVEIAGELGIAVKTVESHMALALRTLRGKLQRFLP